MSLRNLVHCALALMVAFAGLAAVYLQLDAQFVGFAQILVYVGAVAILIVFAILLTRSGEPPQQSVFSSSWLAGVGGGSAVFGVLAWTIVTSAVSQRELPTAARSHREANRRRVDDQVRAAVGSRRPAADGRADRRGDHRDASQEKEQGAAQK